MQGPLENTEHHHSTFWVSLDFQCFSVATTAAATSFKKLIGFDLLRRYPYDWIPFGDHPLKLERYRED
jgi:hypothetical protein